LTGVCVNLINSDLLRDEIMESKLEAVMALAALLQVSAFITFHWIFLF